MYKTAAKFLGVVALLVAGTSFSVTQASAQETIETCGANIETTLAPRAAPRTITSTSFVTVASQTFPIGPKLLADCAIVTFNAETACRGSNQTNVCYVRILDNGAEMVPNAGGTRILDSNSTAAMRTVIYSKRGLTTGNHTFTVQVRVGQPGTTLLLDDWTTRFDLQS